MKSLGLLITLLFASPVLGGINEWTYVGLSPEYINSIEVDPTNSDIVYVSAFDVYYDSTAEGGLFRTADRGLTWDTLGFRHSNVHDVAIDPTSPWIVWIANDEWGVWRSEDYGDHWVNRSNGIYMGGVDHWGPDKIAVCPHDSRYLMCLTGSWVSLGWAYFTDNAGDQWQSLPGMYVDGARWMTFDPSMPGVVYVTDVDRNHALISQDTGRSFTELPPYGFASMLGLKTAPSSPGAVWRLTWELGLQKSIDFGQTWNRDTERFLGSDTVIRDIDVAGEGDTLAFATSYGPFLTFDGGDSVFAVWANHPAGVPVDVVRIVSVQPFEIWVVRRFRGIWTYTYSGDTTAARNDIGTRSRVLKVTVGPNPSSGTLWISSNNARLNGMPIKIDVFNVLGQRVLSRPWDGTARSMSISLPTGLSAGTYFIRVGPEVEGLARPHMQRFTLVR